MKISYTPTPVDVLNAFNKVNRDALYVIWHGWSSDLWNIQLDSPSFGYKESEALLHCTTCEEVEYYAELLGVKYKRLKSLFDV